jgi:trimethylamine--corrinoid protein Co-methyltransferase
VKHVVGGIRVSDERLAVDDIARVGAFGDFLSLDATLVHMREQSQPALIDRRVREDWEERGSTDMYQRALLRAREILETHVPEPLPGDVRRRLRKIVDDADRELAGA